MYTQREFGRRDLRSAAWVIIQSSCSHISHFESHRLWVGTDLSYTQVAHVQAPKRKEKQKKKQKKTTHAHNLVRQMLFHFRGNVILRYSKPGNMMTLNYCLWLPRSVIFRVYQSVSQMKAKAQFIYHQRLFFSYNPTISQSFWIMFLYAINNLFVTYTVYIQVLIAVPFIWGALLHQEW